MTSPQVCDRCRLKKIGCDGIQPQCGNCASAKVQCTVSVKLRRKTKPRRYVQPGDEQVERLRAENQALKDQLGIGTSIHVSDSTSQALTSPGVPGIPAPNLQTYQSPSSHRDLPPGQSQRSSETYHQYNQLPDPVIKHMGRLVSSSSGVYRFAGSTTGVHFIHSAELKYQQLFRTTEMFSESVYGLHMVPQPMSLYKNVGLGRSIRHLFPQPRLRQPRLCYLPRIDRFFKRWGSIYPVLFSKQFYEAFHIVFDCLEAPTSSVQDVDVAQLHQIIMVLAIDAWDDSGDATWLLTEDAAEFFSFFSQATLQVVERGDLSGLQSLILYSIFLQLSGQHSLLTQVSGMAVRLAQSLGLHRHSRRFKFGAGELEMRNRIWWCVFMIDLVSSISYGLPKLIKDADVDTDLPLDRDFDDMTVAELPFSLPGEATRFSIFLTLCRLARIISTCVQQLYTTTMRRGAVDKILMFDRELRIWEHNFNTSFGTKALGVLDVWGSAPSGVPGDQRFSVDDQAFAVPYIQIMGSLGMVLIHQPALTFGTEYPQFQKSLAACVRGCISILSIFDKCRNERRIFYLQPSAARLIFQSALMCLYHCWHFRTSLISIEESPTELPISHIIDVAIRLLELQISDCSMINSRESMNKDSSTSEILNDTILVLRTLLATTLGNDQFNNINPSPSSVLGSGDLHSQQSNDSTADPWQLSALNNLNQLDMLDWSQDQDFDTSNLDSYMLESSLPWQ